MSWAGLEEIKQGFIDQIVNRATRIASSHNIYYVKLQK